MAHDDGVLETSTYGAYDCPHVFVLRSFGTHWQPLVQVVRPCVRFPAAAAAVTVTVMAMASEVQDEKDEERSLLGEKPMVAALRMPSRLDWTLVRGFNTAEGTLDRELLSQDLAARQTGQEEEAEAVAERRQDGASDWCEIRDALMRDTGQRKGSFYSSAEDVNACDLSAGIDTGTTRLLRRSSREVDEAFRRYRGRARRIFHLRVSASCPGHEDDERTWKFLKRRSVS